MNERVNAIAREIVQDDLRAIQPTQSDIPSEMLHLHRDAQFAQLAH